MKGVQLKPPPERLIPSINAAIDQAMANLHPDEKGTVVGLATESGVNAAFVARAGKGWEVIAYAAKAWGRKPVTLAPEYGAGVRKSWR